MTYYKNFSIIIGSPLWRVYLRWIYSKCIDDFAKIDFTPNFTKEGFTCLLCGVGNEATADEFIRFVLARNINSTIWIIDMGAEQVEAVTRMITQKYPGMNIHVKKTNALDLVDMLGEGSIDWIETDGLFEFFDYETLDKLLKVWSRLLSKDGFATTRATSTSSKFGGFFDKLKVILGSKWLGITAYTHNMQKMHEMILRAGFRFVVGGNIIPIFRRYSMIPRNRLQ